MTTDRAQHELLKCPPPRPQPSCRSTRSASGSSTRQRAQRLSGPEAGRGGTRCEWRTVGPRAERNRLKHLRRTCSATSPHPGLERPATARRELALPRRHLSMRTLSAAARYRRQPAAAHAALSFGADPPRPRPNRCATALDLRSLVPAGGGERLGGNSSSCGPFADTSSAAALSAGERGAAQRPLAPSCSAPLSKLPGNAQPDPNAWARPVTDSRQAPPSC